MLMFCFVFVHPAKAIDNVIPVAYTNALGDTSCPMNYLVAGEFPPAQNGTMHCCSDMQTVSYTDALGDTMCPAGFKIYGVPQGSGNGTMSCCYEDQVPPAVGDVFFSTGTVLVSGTDTFTITMKVIENDSGFKTIRSMIFKDSHWSNPRGYYAWHPTSYYFTDDQIVCAGGGFASKKSISYGANTVELISCLTSVSGNERTVNFEIRPIKGVWTNVDNFDVAVYADDMDGNNSGWKDFWLNINSNVMPDIPSLVKPPDNVLTDDFDFCATVADIDGDEIKAVFVIGGTEYNGNFVSSGLNSCYTYTSNLLGVNWHAYAVDTNGITSNNSVTWKAIINQTPIAGDLSFLNPTASEACALNIFNVYLKWNFIDSAFDTESAYQIIIDDDADMASPIFDSGKCLGFNNPNSNCSIDVEIGNFSLRTHGFLPLQTDPYNKEYYWWVKVWDSSNLESPWASSDTSGVNFTTYKHEFPYIDFIFSPAIISKDEEVLFTDTSVTYGGTDIASWEWNFESGNPLTSIASSVQMFFTGKGTKNINLKVTDDDLYYCNKTEAIDINYALPDWVEAH